MKKLYLFLTLFISCFSYAFAEDNTLSSKISPNEVKTSSIDTFSKLESLYDDSDVSAFTFEKDDVKLWIEYNYNYSRLSNIFFMVEDPEDINLTIELYRNNILLKTYTSRIYHNMIKQKTLNFIIPDDVISDKVIIYNRASRGSQGQDTLATEFKYTNIKLLGSEIKIDYDKSIIDNIMDSFFERTDTYGKEKALLKYQRIETLIKSMQNKDNTYYLIEYMLFRIQDKIYNVEKEITYEKAISLLD